MKSQIALVYCEEMNIVLFDTERRFDARDERYKHITRILGKTAGDVFFAGRINGPSGNARILRCDASGLDFEFEETLPFRPLYPVRLIIGFPRPIQLKRLLRDLASLGAEKIILAGTDLGEKSYRESRLADPSVAHKNIMDGCIQAGGTAVPGLSITTSVDAALQEEQSGNALRFVLDLAPDTVPLFGRDYAGVCDARPLVLAIGSERGWSERERVLFRSCGYEPCSLGKRILRTETAATAACAIALAASGLMEGQ